MNLPLNKTQEDERLDDTVRCKNCGQNQWICRYNNYELWGTCVNCGNEESLHSG